MKSDFWQGAELFDSIRPGTYVPGIGGAAPACYDVAIRRATHQLLDRKPTVISSPTSTLREEDARPIGNGSRPTKRRASDWYAGFECGCRAYSGESRNRETWKFGDGYEEHAMRHFRKAIQEFKPTFPEPGAVSGDPAKAAPYGFFQNDLLPGWVYASS